MSPFPSPVTKPANAGAGQTAIVSTRAAYVNVRNGPGTDFQDIGDIYDHSVLVYYPQTRTDRDWIWVERGSLVGWIAEFVVSFEDVSATPPTTSTHPTPYDDKVGVWHWKGDVLAENTIDELAQNIKRLAPYVTEIFVKVCDYTPRSGPRWQGEWDNKRALAIDGPSSIDQWVQVLGRYGMNFHAWCVARGLDTQGETNLIVQSCLRPGVRSLILDVEPYDGFWSAGREGVRPFMLRIRRQIPGSFHIGISVDPRSQHYPSVFPEEWFPFVNSVHPQVYWETFRETPEDALNEAFNVWGGYGRPVVPVLQGDAKTQDMRAAHDLAVQHHKVPGLSWWRLGVLGPTQLQAINQPITPGEVPPEPPVVTPGRYGEEVVVKPGDSGFAKGAYTGQDEFSTFLGTWGWNVYYKSTTGDRSAVWVQWSPTLPRSGKYEVSVFIPNRHASTQKARYKIHGVKSSSAEVTVEVDQSRYKNQWVSLGIFDFDKGAVNAGSVFTNDLTYENQREIAFDAIRWREVLDETAPEPGGSGPVVVPVGYADGFDAPIGTLSERRSSQVWPGKWYDASPFAHLYFVGTPNEAYHTGADLNLPSDADAHTSVYAAASGVVTFASRLKVWGNVIVIKHDPLAGSGRVMYGRYAHVEQLGVQVGQRVQRGQEIAHVGNAFGQWAYHLHFDLSPTTILESQPQHWPAKDLANLLANYVNPRDFILQNRPK